MTIEQERQQLVAEALTWAGTPYHPHARVKGAGCDCLTLLVGSFQACGFIDPIARLPNYAKDWHLQKPAPGKEAEAELYMNAVLQYCDEFEGDPLPGDIILWRFGWLYAHGAIVTAWPRIIHAYSGRPVQEEDYSRARYLQRVFEVTEFKNQPRPFKLFRLKAWGA